MVQLETNTQANIKNFQALKKTALKYSLHIIEDKIP